MQSIVILVSLAAVAFFVWQQVIAGKPSDRPRAYFLDAGQGDSELIVLPGGVKFMTDAGPDGSVLSSLGRVMPEGDRYIDIAIVSHPQLDHFNGFNFVLDQYSVGAFVINGRSDTKGVAEWPQLLEKIRSKNIPLITLGAGDSMSYGSSTIDFISPNAEFVASGELNDTGFVELVKTPDFRELLTADIGFNVEDRLVGSGVDLGADILKVPHHGSKYSSGDGFLAAVHPKVAVIEVGAHNTYGHPTKEALARLASSGARVFRTDLNGTVEIFKDGGKLAVVAEKN